MTSDASLVVEIVARWLFRHSIYTSLDLFFMFDISPTNLYPYSGRNCAHTFIGKRIPEPGGEDRGWSHG
jgi:hypothetical protein